ncbi:hypothetical protein E0K89_010525 [Aquicoccus sp. SCR17]|nr:hypothetical protein [Carideicomes alvinocaridis]
MLNGLILLVVVLAGGVLLYPRLARAVLWRAAITPLASIIGSGFLVLGPILDASYGALAPLVMGALCLGAYLFGAAVRFNIARLDGRSPRSRTEEELELAASWMLAFAYIVSVAYYLNLLGAFSVSLTALDDPYHAKLVTSAVFIVILMVGWTRGFAALERLEQVTVGLKLAIIAGLLFGLAWYFGARAAEGALVVNPALVTGWPALTLGAGLLVTVQGFETSRYLGEDYDAATRIRSMRLAQGIASLIYMVYILLLSYVFAQGTLKLSETAIIDLMEIVAPILPILLIFAAISAQFSAAVADTGGSGGLLAELTRRRLSPRGGYLLLTVVGLVLTWVASVFEIISYASRAFAAYYALQSLIAARGAWATGQRRRGLAFAVLGVLGLAIALLGTAVEG